MGLSLNPFHFPQVNLPSFEKIKNIHLTKDQKRVLKISAFAVFTLGLYCVIDRVIDPAYNWLRTVSSPDASEVKNIHVKYTPVFLQAKPEATDLPTFAQMQVNLTADINRVMAANIAEGQTIKISTCEQQTFSRELMPVGLFMEHTNQTQYDTMISYFRMALSDYLAPRGLKDALSYCYEISTDYLDMVRLGRIKVVYKFR